VPLLLAEGDRDAYRRERAALAREQEIMKDVKDWEVRLYLVILDWPTDSACCCFFVITPETSKGGQERLQQPTLPVTGVDCGVVGGSRNGYSSSNCFVYGDNIFL
jgi:hypothetical protein